ncbi:hypothetical protein BH787_gp24 [Gordonia phage GMA4]|uniref:hypothetical protein n=1 Tax=Gordonia phage GMA4 TaxID=1647471 RepID=UPI0006BDAB3E|nr:hypothetical protein BH787_gp24 [Gordonia phage GMA4]AKJ72324.1 hypothetical protein GMA4_49 [Gordonia phage GMA4]
MPDHPRTRRGGVVVTGAEHYREAERLVREGVAMPAGAARSDTIAAASVHAILAHAAAVLDGEADRG